MYIDDYYPSDYPDDYLGDYAPAYPEEVTSGPVHLCAECRELMAEVVRVVGRIPPPPPVPDWSRALDWLAAQCGGRAAVPLLDAAPLSGDDLVLPDDLAPDDRRRLESTLTLLDAVARRFFDEEAGIALRRALLRVHERRRGLVVGARSAPLLALGVVWAVGHANGLLHPSGGVTEKELKAYLNVNGAASTLGRRVRDALCGPYTWDSPDRPWRWRSGTTGRDLEPLGHLDLLTSTTRRQLVAVRERARADRDATAVLAG